MSAFAGPADWWTNETNDGRTHIATKGVVQSGLVLNLDAGVSSSYPSSGTTWTDLTGNGNNGTLANGPTFNIDNGGSIVFDGSNDQVNVANASSLNFTVGLTLSSWFRFTALAGGELGFFRKNVQWQLGMIDASTIRCLVATNGTTGWTAGNDVSYTFATNTWYNMTMTYNGSNMRIYVNNELVKTATVTGAITPTTEIVNIGYWAAYLNGRIAISQIYNRSLSEAEINQNFNALRGRFGI